MLENIRFCYCSRIELEEENAMQCMFFSFTERASKILSNDFLSQITDSSPEENYEKTGIPLFDREINNGDKVFVKKVGENKYRIETRYIEPFIRCLFKYLPAYYVQPGQGEEDYTCDMREQDDES
ncbi:hypothetical protein ACFL6L_00535 [candidate division KSB1 bacterium]